MRVLHVITSLQTGGAEKLMVDLLPRLRDAGHEVELAVFNGQVTPFFEHLHEKGIPIHRFMPGGGNVYNPLNLLKLYRLVRKGGYDVVHTHNTAPQLFAAIGSVLCSVVLCTTEHNTSNRRRSWRWYASIDRWMYSRYKAVVCISEKTECHLKAFIGENITKIVTISNGIDIEKYRHAITFDIKSEYQDCKTAVVQIAGFRYQKDQDTVIKALTKLPDDIHLFLVGDGERRKELEDLTNNLNLSHRVHFMGIRYDVAEILKGADIAVMSSHWEGFGLAAVEAMATRTPIIATDVDGLREVVKGAGILFPHQDAEALAREILELDSNPVKYKAIADNCYRRALRFDISRMVSNYINLYQSL